MIDFIYGAFILPNALTGERKKLHRYRRINGHFQGCNIKSRKYRWQMKESNYTFPHNTNSSEKNNSFFEC